jgi:multidrug efflux pump subunit AcrB
MKTLIVIVVLSVVGVVGLGFYRGWFSFSSNSAQGKSKVTLTTDQNKIKKDEKTAVKKVKDLGNQVKDQIVTPTAKVSEGTMVSLEENELTIKDKEGKEQAHTLADDVKVTCDTQTCKATDLKAGMRIRVTTGSDAPHNVSQIEALDKNEAFAKSS